MSKVTTEWLSDSASIKGILVEATASIYDTVNVQWVETKLYLSNIGYMTSDSLTSFNPIITGGLQLTESLSLEGTISMSFGDISVNNPNGGLDSWLDASKYIWVNRAIKVYIGDPRWICASISDIRADFELVFSGLISDVDSSARETLNLKIRDSLERLNTPLTEAKIGTYGVWAGGQTNQDTIKPIIFGEVFNMSPLLIDPSQLEYLYCNVASSTLSTERIIEIRDNGVPIYNVDNTSNVLVNLTKGTFKLLKTPIGAITASIQGINANINLTAKTLSPQYTNTVTNIIATICTQYGNTATRLSIAELDSANLIPFNLANPVHVGVCILDRQNVLAVCQNLLSSISAQLYITKTGLLQILKVGVPTSDPTTYITNDDILHHSLSIVNKLAVMPSTKLGYCKNWTVQTNLISNIPAAHKDSFGEEWLSVTIIDSATTSLYSLSTDPVQKDTLLVDNTATNVEANRLTNYYKVARVVYKFTGTAKLFTLKLGQRVSLTHNRFNLNNGKLGQVISLTYNWLAGTIEVQVLV